MDKKEYNEHLDKLYSSETFTEIEELRDSYKSACTLVKHLLKKQELLVALAEGLVELNDWITAETPEDHVKMQNLMLTAEKVVGDKE